MLTPLLLLALGCLCPNERDQLRITATLEDFPAAGIDCTGGCGFMLAITMLPEDEGTPQDVEAMVVSLAVGDGDAPSTVVWAHDIDRYNFPEAYTKARFDLQVNNPASRSVAFSLPAQRPSAIAKPEEEALTGDACNILEEITFDLTFQGAEATVLGGSDSAEG